MLAPTQEIRVWADTPDHSKAAVINGNAFMNILVFIECYKKQGDRVFAAIPDTYKTYYLV